MVTKLWLSISTCTALNVLPRISLYALLVSAWTRKTYYVVLIAKTFLFCFPNLCGVPCTLLGFMAWSYKSFCKWTLFAFIEWTFTSKWCTMCKSCCSTLWLYIFEDLMLLLLFFFTEISSRNTCLCCFLHQRSWSICTVRLLFTSGCYSKKQRWEV
jgi:hypothetical protein